jgi:hypothetical protein
MGLKNIHVVFISMAIALCLGLGWWCVVMFRNQGGPSYLVFGLASFGAALGLTVYGNWFLRKMKGLHTS